MGLEQLTDQMTGLQMADVIHSNFDKVLNAESDENKAENAGLSIKTDYDATRYIDLQLADGTPVKMKMDVFCQAIAPVVAELMGKPKGTVNFKSWDELNNHINNQMDNYTCQFFTSSWKAFDGQGFHGNLVQGFMIRVLTDNYILFGISSDGRIVFRKGDSNGWSGPTTIL